MTDKIQLHNQPNTGNISDGNMRNDQPDGAAEGHQGIFDELFSAVMNSFGEACEQKGIGAAIAIAEHPETKKPLVFVRGHLFDVTALGIKVINQMRAQLLSELSVSSGE